MLGRVTSIGNTIQTSHKMQIELQFAKVLLVKSKSKNWDKMLMRNPPLIRKVVDLIYQV